MAGYNYETKRLKDIKVSRAQGLLSDDLNDLNLAVGDAMTMSGGQNEYALLEHFIVLITPIKEVVTYLRQADVMTEVHVSEADTVSVSSPGFRRMENQ